MISDKSSNLREFFSYFFSNSFKKSDLYICSLCSMGRISLLIIQLKLSLLLPYQIRDRQIGRYLSGHIVQPFTSFRYHAVGRVVLISQCACFTSANLNVFQNLFFSYICVLCFRVFHSPRREVGLLRKKNLTTLMG